MCGIIAVCGSPYASYEAYQGLLLMQHRGQDAAGILSFERNIRTFNIHKDEGLVDKVFSKESLLKLQGEMSIGHTRYSTIGECDEKDIQPITVNFPFGLGLAHNGNLININELKDYLKEKKHRYIYSNNDAEVLLNLLADGLVTYSNKSIKADEYIQFDFNALKESVRDIFQMSKGGYAVVGQIANQGLVAFRDPNGIRPLILGKRELSTEEKQLYSKNSQYSYCLASESNTLNFLGYEVVRDIDAGELLFIDLQGNLKSERLVEKKKRPCIFEHVYFANPESIMDDQNVYSSRLQMGSYLGKKVNKLMKEYSFKPDVIVPVPETSRISAISLSEETGIPYRELLIKNRYIQRSFILNTQKSRERAVSLKLSPVASELKGKNVLLVDDSIVRGTTSKKIIKMVKEAGANEVYFASACSPILHPCFYGIDFPDSKELVASGKTFDQIEKHLEADKVIYLDIEDLKQAVGLENSCMACIDGKYPVEISSAESFNTNRVRNGELNV